MFSVQNCIAKRRDGQSLSIASHTACPGDECNIQCKPNDYQPVCASNGYSKFLKSNFVLRTKRKKKEKGKN